MQNIRVRTTKPKLPPVAVVNLINRVRRSLQGLANRLAPPPVSVLDLVAGGWIMQTIAVFAKLAVADHLYQNQAVSAATLAGLVGTQAEALYRLLRALSTVGKLLLIETIIPGPGVPHFSKLLDLEMLVITTGKERSVEGYRGLLAEAGFSLQRIVPTIGMASLIEAVPV